MNGWDLEVAILGWLYILLLSMAFVRVAGAMFEEGSYWKASVAAGLALCGFLIVVYQQLRA